MTQDDLQQALEDILAELHERGVILSQDDRERVLRTECDRLLGKLNPDALS